MRHVPYFFYQQFQVGGGGAAAAADDGDVVFGDEFVERLGKRFRFERVNGLPIHIERQPGVGDARNGQFCPFAEDADGFAHVFGAGGAVQADDVNRQVFEDGDGGFDVGAEQHAPAGVEGHLALNRQVDAGLFKGFGDAVNGGFDLEDVLRGFDEKQVHPAANQTDGLLAEDIGQLIEGDVGEFGVIGGGEFAGGTDGTGDEAFPHP